MRRTTSLSLLEPAMTFGSYSVGLVARTALAFLPVVRRWGRPAFMRWISGGTPAPAGDPIAAVIDAGIRDYHLALPTPTLFSDEQLRRVSVPTLVLIGGRSVIHDPDAAYQRARTTVPGVHAELWPDATHAISGEHTDRVNRTVLQFIERAESR